MNTRMIGFLLGRILMVEAGLLALPLLTALLYREPLMPWLATMLVLAAIGWGLSLRKPERTALYAKDGFAAVALVWLLMSAFWCIALCALRGHSQLYRRFFETVSGFTTTGASILTAVEPSAGRPVVAQLYPLGWRHGRAGVRHGDPAYERRSHHAYPPGRNAGAYGWQAGQPHERYRQDPLWYVFCHDAGDDRTAASGRHGPFDASVHAFGAAGTGGFSSRNASVGAYNSAYIDIVTGIGMLAFGINFNLYYFLLMRRFRDVAKSEELWAYLGIVAFSTVTIAANIRHLYGAVGTSLRHAFFPGVLHHHHHRLCHGGF